MAQDRSMLAQVGLKTPKMASRGLQDTSKMLREGLKMIKHRFFGRYLFIDFGVTFHQILVDIRLSCLTCLKRPRDGLKVASDGFLEVTLAQLESKLAPSLLYVGLKLGPCWLSWPKLAPTWPQVGLKLASSWRNLGANWA